MVPKSLTPSPHSQALGGVRAGPPTSFLGGVFKEVAEPHSLKALPLVNDFPPFLQKRRNSSNQNPILYPILSWGSGRESQ